MAEDERHLAVAVAMDDGGRLLIDRTSCAPLMVEFEDAWPQAALADLLAHRLGLSIPRSRMAATHLDLGAEVYAHCLWLRLHDDEVASMAADLSSEVAWVSEHEVQDDPSLVAAHPVRAEVLRLAFGWADGAGTVPAIPPKVDPSAVDWVDPLVTRAALDAMAVREQDLMSGVVGDWEVTVGGGDDGVFMLTAYGPGGVINAVGDTEGDDEIDVMVGGDVLALPSRFGLSRANVEQALADLRSGNLPSPQWETDEG